MPKQAVNPSGQQVGYSGPVSLQEITSYGIGRISPETTMSGGQWTGSVTLYRADETSINRGNVNIYAYLAADASINGTSDPFTVHPGPFARLQLVVPGQAPLPGSVSGLVGNPASQAAGVQFTATVYSTDAYWNPVPSGDAVRLTSNDAAANTPLTGSLSNGSRQIGVALGTVGTRTLSVSDQTNGSIQGMTSAGIQVLPSAASQFVIETIPTPITAGVPVAVTIHAADAPGGHEGGADLHDRVRQRRRRGDTQANRRIHQRRGLQRGRPGHNRERLHRRREQLLTVGIVDRLPEGL